MSLSGPLECSWSIDGLELCGLQWGDPDGHPVLALHGWLDNAASFSRLAPQLNGCRVIALDLSGQGKSSFRSADAGYQVWDDLPQLDTLLDILGWQRFSLLGHSRGAIIATLLAGVRPERVHRLVVLDAIVPEPVAAADFAAQFTRYLDDRRVASSASQRRYTLREEAVATRARGDFSLACAETLAARGLQGNTRDGWSWRNDPRLRGASAVKLSAGQVQSILAAIEAPVLLLMASEGLMKHHSIDALLEAYGDNFQVEQVEGGHHFHMEAVIDDWVGIILSFLAPDNGVCLAN